MAKFALHHIPLNDGIHLFTVVTFHFQRAEYSFQEDAGLITLSVLKEGTHEGPTTVIVQTQSQSAQSKSGSACRLWGPAIGGQGAVWLLDGQECGNLLCYN